VSLDRKCASFTFEILIIKEKQCKIKNFAFEQLQRTKRKIITLIKCNYCMCTQWRRIEKFLSPFAKFFFAKSVAGAD
jgi:hypothetical protein